MSARSLAQRQGRRAAYAGAEDWDMSRLNPYIKTSSLRAVWNVAFKEEVERLNEQEAAAKHRTDDPLTDIMSELSTGCFTDNQLDQLSNAFRVLLEKVRE